MAHKFKYHPRPPLTFNMAPMVDVVFLLIIFFVLVSTFATAEHMPLDLPDPDDSQAFNEIVEDRVIINVQLADPDAPATSPVDYYVGPSRAESLEAVSQRLAARKRMLPELKVIIRADKRVRYAKVREVMEVVAENDIQMMNLAAIAGGHGGQH